MIEIGPNLMEAIQVAAAACFGAVAFWALFKAML
jgi:hypothetical protein